MSVPCIRRLLLTGTALFAATGTAHAQSSTAGTNAGVIVTNTAQATYSVNGTAQAPVSSNSATFVVDRKVNLTVVWAQSAPVPVNLGDTMAVTTYTVTNTTNGTQDFLLGYNQIVPVGILTGTDDFNLSNVRIFVDSNDNAIYEPDLDTATFIDELEADSSRSVFIVGDIPSTGTNSIAQIGLDVAVATGGSAGRGAELTETVGANRNAQVDIVLADNDNDGTLGYDTPRNGHAWAYGAYQVTIGAVALTVNKSALVLYDPVNLFVTPKAIPGAVVQYCLTVANGTRGTPATNVSLTDMIPDNTTYVAGSIKVGGIGAAGVCLLNGVSVADDGSSTGVYTGSFSQGKVTATIATLLGGTSVAASFQVTVQ